MFSRLARLGQTVGQRISRLPVPVLAGLGVLGVAGAVIAGVLLFRTYDYVQHDNNFCISCHLMADPFDRFAQSAHRDLGCKACHQPTMVVRTRMALTQVIENPEEIKTHAEVSSEACMECHVRGRPEEWTQISQSAGHRVHLESTDPSLRELECVKCHSSSVHEFAATDQTCGQAGCHENTRIQLGEMGRLTIHCASCHDFNRPVSASVTADSLSNALRPQRQECLSCHAMRNLLADFPEHDPHDAACGACHNPHDQETPAAAVQSCATGGCHTAVDTVTPMHRGLDISVLSNCTACHSAHEFTAPTDCMQCHQSIFTTAAPVTTTSVGRPRADSLQFNHARHRNVQCAACHESTETHGRVAIASFTECRQCHHTGQVAQTCTSCHSRTELTGTYTKPQAFRVANRPAGTRQLPFRHADHQRQDCNSCHQPGLEQSAAAVSCTSCHEQHHTDASSCIACHRVSPIAEHNARAHLTCAGAGCHAAATVQPLTRTRNLCLSCHQAMVDHMPGRTCADCHALPAQRTSSAGDAGPIVQPGTRVGAAATPLHRYAHGAVPVTAPPSSPAPSAPAMPPGHPALGRIP